MVLVGLRMSFELAYSLDASPSCHVADQPGVLLEFPNLLLKEIEFLVLSQIVKSAATRSGPFTVGSQPLLVNHGSVMIT